MYPTTDDYQTGALYGPAPNYSTLTADMLNPAASGPNDWQTILTNGVSTAAVNGINGAINNAVTAGQIQNAMAARPLANVNLKTLLIIGAVIVLVLR